MNQPVFDINPNELNNIDSLRTALNQTLNFINTIYQQNQELIKQNQNLKDEINRLKGEKGKPKILPNAKQIKDISSKKYTKENKPWIKHSKKHIIKIDNRIHCPIEKDNLPTDAVFKGYETVISQDIIFKRNNTEYTIEKWYSPSQRKTYTSSLPKHTGYFGNNLKAFCITMHYAMDITRNKLLSLLHGMGIEISDGSLQNILTENSQEWITEKDDLLKAGMHGPYFQTDSTGARVKGQNQYTHVFVSEFFSVFSTIPNRTRLDLLSLLQGQPEGGILLTYNLIAQKYLEHFKILKYCRRELRQIFTQTPILRIKEFELRSAVLSEKLQKKPYSYKWIIESLALGYYFEQTVYPSPEVLITDDAPEYKLLSSNHMLCWIHDARFYNKLTPFVKRHRVILEEFKKSYWQFYELLKKYRQNPSIELRSDIENGFDQLFIPNSLYFNLNKEIERTAANKKSLLTVLDFPFIPLHNNASELAARRQVRKRDICIHTMTDLGTKLQDAFMSIMHTSSLLGIDAYQYILNRLNNDFEFYLPNLVLKRIKARKKYMVPAFN